MSTSRREAIALGFAEGALLPFTQTIAIAHPAASLDPRPKWRRGIEGQRIADLGDCRHLNPIMAGDHPEPSISKDGRGYYMTFSSFEA